MENLSFDIAHLFAGGLVLVSFMLLYQDRMTGLINIFTLHAIVLSLSVAWQAYTQRAPHLYLTAAIAVLFKAVIIPLSLQRIMVRLRIHRDIEVVGGVGVTMLLGICLVACPSSSCFQPRPPQTPWRAKISPSRCPSSSSACS